MAFEFTDANFKETLSKNSVSVVDFWAEWCGPCRLVAPIIDELSTEYEGSVAIGKMNVDHNQSVPMQFGIRSIPTILIFKGDELAVKHVGTITKAALTQKIEEQLATV